MDARKYIQILGQVIREKRLQLGYSQESLAEEVGLHRTYIGQIERGEKNITISSLLRISKALNLTISKIFSKVESH